MEPTPEQPRRTEDAGTAIPIGPATSRLPRNSPTTLAVNPTLPDGEPPSTQNTAWTDSSNKIAASGLLSAIVLSAIGSAAVTATAIAVFKAPFDSIHIPAAVAAGLGACLAMNGGWKTSVVSTVVAASTQLGLSLALRALG